MTPDQQREQGRLMMEAADHPEWEWEYSRDDGKTWYPCDPVPPLWDFIQLRYRRRPEPRLVPWTPDQARGKWVRPKGEKQGMMVTEFDCSDDTVFIGGSWVTMTELLSLYEQLDGSPCGEVEK